MNRAAGVEGLKLRAFGQGVLAHGLLVEVSRGRGRDGHATLAIPN